jgi:RNA exonuclease 4
MAIYRLHRKQWDRAFNVAPIRVKLQAEGTGAATSSSSSTTSKGKRKYAPEAGEGEGEKDTFAPQAIRREPVTIAKSGAVQRKGTSSGLSVVVKHAGKSALKRSEGSGNSGGQGKRGWWKELGAGGNSSGAKGGMKLSMRS